ncbi:TPA: beta-CASP ribonuclease aCPSF1 [Candidatus Woesearchaeota archaeon]|nr:KH-domain/beta-lactamase-domain protein [archaeon GW2011_AR15]MBS3103658.1 beta-CASP ribonuclease aCPSF1 [Candidatus Woesearchaeota archaeon]HIH41740.1 beta-CASP ribonuclease aCPSF1 [Candidatus Woesearchaeota archaeon]
MSEILKEILKELPDGKISDAGFEGANIVLYTKDRKFVFEANGMIKDIVNKIKKRIELRPDPSITHDSELAEKEIREIIPAEAKIDQIIFDPQRSIVIIEAEKPGVAIGKQGENLKAIKEKVLWVPVIKRTPAIRSQIIENIRAVLYQNSDYRRKFLHKVGQRIYNGWLRGKKDEWIRISYLGSGRQVGRSCLFLQTPESRILMDCGVDVADENNAYPLLEAPEFKIEELDAIIISHSHLDHCGFLPYLFKYGYRGPVYCTQPTRDVMALMLLDYVKIMRYDGKEPIYTSEEIKEMVKHTITLEFEEVTDITPDVRLTFYNAGHILGSAMCHLHIGNGLHNLVYSADMKFGKSVMLSPAATQFPRCETLLLESTYGGKDNILPTKKEMYDYLRDVINETIDRGGKCLIPVLGSGRAQDLMIMVEELIRTKEVRKVDVFIDGLIWDITAIHTAYPEFLNSSIRKQIFHRDNNPFLSDIFKRIGSGKERQQVIEETGSCIILATSGMLVGGPSVEYLRALADNSNNSLVFSSYQGAGSLGRRIQNGEREISFKDGHKQEICQIKMDVHKLEISDHSDRKELMNYVARCSPRPRKIILNHGESSRCLDLASSLHKNYRVETTAPRNLEAVRLK